MLKSCEICETPFAANRKDVRLCQPCRDKRRRKRQATWAKQDRERNPERSRAIRNAYRKRNSEKERDYNSAWKKKNPARHAAINLAQYHARMKRQRQRLWAIDGIQADLLLAKLATGTPT